MMIFSIIMLIIIWTWGLTPLWANVIISVILGLTISLLTLRVVLRLVYDDMD